MILAGNCSGSSNPGSNYLGAIFLAGNFLDTFGNYLGAIFFEGNYPRGDNPGGGGNHPGSNCLRGNLTQGQLSGNPY